MLKGRRTYITIALMTVVALQGIVPEFTFIPELVSAPLIALLGALATYFRSKA